MKASLRTLILKNSNYLMTIEVTGWISLNWFWDGDRRHLEYFEQRLDGEHLFDHCEVD
jgi:hypothetical protein